MNNNNFASNIHLTTHLKDYGARQYGQHGQHGLRLPCNVQSLTLNPLEQAGKSVYHTPHSLFGGERSLFVPGRRLGIFHLPNWARPTPGPGPGSSCCFPELAGRGPTLPTGPFKRGCLVPAHDPGISAPGSPCNPPPNPHRLGHCSQQLSTAPAGCRNRRCDLWILERCRTRATK